MDQGDDALVAESAPAPVEAIDDARYLTAITACGDRRPLAVSQAIYSATGVKLLERGAKFDSRILERLFAHTLAEPIDRCVTSPDAVRHRDLVTRTRELVEAMPSLAHFEKHLGAPSERLWSALGACPLPPAIAMRLTVARDTAATLYEHSLKASFLALFIGVSARFADRDLQNLATAALLHDIGMLHADPALFEGERPLASAGRRSLYAHPITGQLIAQREPLLNQAIATAIAQHHERLDGTGYPRGLAGDDVGKLGRVLMLVEPMLALLEHGRERPELQLSLALRLNHRGYDTRLSEAVLAALPRVALVQVDATGETPGHPQVNAWLQAWTSLRERMPPAAGDPAAAFINERIARLHRWLAEAGLADWDAAEQVAKEAPPIVRAEIAAVARETLWQIRQIAQEVSHRWPQHFTAHGDAAPSAAREWVAAVL